MDNIDTKSINMLSLLLDLLYLLLDDRSILSSV